MKSLDKNKSKEIKGTLYFKDNSSSIEFYEIEYNQLGVIITYYTDNGYGHNKIQTSFYPVNKIDSIIYD